MKLRANAKINLTLDIVGKRADGYHLIDSVFQSVSICDFVSVEKDNSISVHCNDGSINDKSNIAYKAAQRFFDYTKLDGGAKIVIEKHIPLAAGLGGGSADAAAVIVALDKLYETSLTQNELCSIGVSVGADVPFCIVGGTERVSGIGEKLEKLPDIPDCTIVLIKHGTKQSTADMYKKIDSCTQVECHTQAVVEALENGDIKTVCENISNAFSAVCNNSALINDIKTTEPMAVSLSGSGPTVLAVYHDDNKANIAANSLKDIGYDVIVTKPINSGIIFE